MGARLSPHRLHSRTCWTCTTETSTPRQWTATGESRWSAELHLGKLPLRHDRDVDDRDERELRTWHCTITGTSTPVQEWHLEIFRRFSAQRALWVRLCRVTGKSTTLSMNWTGARHRRGTAGTCRCVITGTSTGEHPKAIPGTQVCRNLIPPSLQNRSPKMLNRASQCAKSRQTRPLTPISTVDHPVNPWNFLRPIGQVPPHHPKPEPDNTKSRITTSRIIKQTKYCTSTGKRLSTRPNNSAHSSAEFTNARPQPHVRHQE